MSIVEDFIKALEVGERSGALTVEKTLDLILAKARRHTSAEAGSIFIVRPDVETPEILQACSLQNDRVSVSADMFSLPINLTSIVGYVAKTGDVVEIEDLYTISPSMPYKFNRSFDEKDGYISKSMLAFPLKNYQGKVIGVVQLLNHISKVNDMGGAEYAPFPFSYVDDMKSLVTVLGAMVERADLLFEIKRLKSEIRTLQSQ